MTEETAMKAPGRMSVWAAYFMIYVVWGSTYYFIGVALRGFPPFLLGGLRFAAAGLLLLAYSGLRGERVFRGSLVRKSAVSGIVLLFIDMSVIMLAQQYLSSSLVAILAATTALWIMVLDVPMWRMNFRVPSVVGGMAAGFLGVVLLFMEQLFRNDGAVRHEFGVVLLMLGCISWSLGTLYAKYRSCAEERVNEFAGAAWQMLAAGGMFWLCSFAGGEVSGTRWEDVPPSSWLALAYLVSFGSVLAYTSYIWLLKVRPAAEVGTHAYVNPLVAVLLGTAVGGESITGVQLGGLGLILVSVRLAARLRH